MRNSSSRWLVAIFASLWPVCCIFGYDTETHALITRQAIENSVLGTQSIYSALGLDRLAQTAPFNLHWNQPSHTTPYYFTDGMNSIPFNSMYPEAFESCNMAEFLKPNVDPNFVALFINTVPDSR